MSNDTTRSINSSISTSLEGSESSSTISTEKLLPQRNGNYLETSSSSSSSSTGSTNSSSSDSSTSRRSFHSSSIESIKSRSSSSEHITSLLRGSSHEKSIEAKPEENNSGNSQREAIIIDSVGVMGARLDEVTNNNNTREESSVSGRGCHHLDPEINAVEQEAEEMGKEQEKRVVVPRAMPDVASQEVGREEDGHQSICDSEVPPDQKTSQLDDLSGLPLTPIPPVPQSDKEKRRQAAAQPTPKQQQQQQQPVKGEHEGMPLLEVDTPPPRLSIAREPVRGTSSAPPTRSGAAQRAMQDGTSALLSLPPKTEREKALHSVACQAVDLSERLASALCDAKREIQRLKAVTAQCGQCRAKMRREASSSKPTRKGAAAAPPARHIASAPPGRPSRVSGREENAKVSPVLAAAASHKAKGEPNKKATSRATSRPPTVVCTYHQTDNQIHYMLGATGARHSRSRDRVEVKRHGLWGEPAASRRSNAPAVSQPHQGREEEDSYSMNYYAWRTCHQALDELQRLLLAEEELSFIKKQEGKSKKGNT